MKQLPRGTPNAVLQWRFTVGNASPVSTRIRCSAHARCNELILPAGRLQGAHPRWPVLQLTPILQGPDRLWLVNTSRLHCYAFTASGFRHACHRHGSVRMLTMLCRGGVWLERGGLACAAGIGLYAWGACMCALPAGLPLQLLAHTHWFASECFGSAFRSAPLMRPGQAGSLPGDLGTNWPATAVVPHTVYPRRHVY